MVDRKATQSLLRCSASTVLRLEEAGRLGPVRVAGMREVQYRRAEVEKLREERLGPGRDSLTGEIAASAFEMFESGSSRADVVRLLRLHPDDVDALAGRWREMRDTSISLTAAELEEIRRALGVATAPIRRARDLVAAIGERISQPAAQPESSDSRASATEQAPAAVSARLNDFDFEYLRAGAKRMRPYFSIYAVGLLAAIDLYLAGKTDRSVLDGYVKTLDTYLACNEPEGANEAAVTSATAESKRSG